MLLVLDKTLKEVAAFDVFESLIWTDRFVGYGDFEIYSNASREVLDILKDDYYIWSSESEHIMIIEDSKINFDINNGDKIITSGRSLESILNRRIIWEQTILSGNLEAGIRQILNDNIISPTISERAIPNLTFEASTDPNISNISIDAQFNRGTNLYDAINNMCISNNIGFKITLSPDNKFVFKLYTGKDRSYIQTSNPYVVFSPKFDNMLSSNYQHSNKNLKNVSLVVGEETNDVGIPQKEITVGAASAIDRREVYTDATGISQTTDEKYLSDAEYNSQLYQKGLETLFKSTSETSLESKVDTTQVFKYGEDFFMGDIIQLISDYGVEGRARISEMIHSENTKEVSTYPKFEIIK